MVNRHQNICNITIKEPIKSITMKMKIRQLLTMLTIPVFLIGGYACSDSDETATPIAPILMNVVIPQEDDILPGTATRIAGLGFSREDKVYLIDDNNNKVEMQTVTATDSYIEFIIPAEVGGEHYVMIERAGQTTILPNKIKIPFIVPLSNILMPEESIVQQGEVMVKGDGFEEGDMAVFRTSFYPEDVDFSSPVTITTDGIRFDVPAGVYGVNSIVIVRENRRSTIGTITIETNVGDRLGGGIVYWVDNAKAHGLICNMTWIGNSEGKDKWGPEVGMNNAMGTSQEIGTGKQNTKNIVTKMAALMAEYNWQEWIGVKIAAEICDEYSVVVDGFTYNDWFLPSRQELIELFKVKSMLINKGVVIKSNNYWTSSEGEGDRVGWAAYYVNFYESTNIISNSESKSKWEIGVLPVREY